ncbi:MAG: site-specific integrase [Liquorilactobacillus satsumensis]|uniref:tyrosine-type recombinase/integrase n=1 Tax=Liquorilactobacillus satsumensis TaxID=259059 RepID=UPI0039EAF705
MAKTKFAGVYSGRDGRFYFDVQLGVDTTTGKRIRKKSAKDADGQFFTSATAAHKEVVRLKAEYDRNSGHTAYALTYGVFMRQTYVPSYQTSVQPATFESRKQVLNTLINRFDEIELRKIDVRMVQDFKNWLMSRTGYSQSYSSMIFGNFRKTLDFAVEMNYLPSNISKRVKAVPKGRATVPYWTKAEFQAVLNQICIADYYEHLNFVMLYCYFMTGVRVNEGMALQWADVDFTHEQMRVTHMLVLKSKNNWERHNYTKTEAGLRTISLDQDTLEILRVWKKRQRNNGFGNPDDFIFSYDGNPMLKSTLMRIIKRYAKLANVHPIQGKGLRHSHASYLINEFNVSVLVLSKRLGHSSPEITLRHYAHMYVGADRELAKMMSGHIAFSTPPKTRVNFTGNQAVAPLKLRPQSLNVQKA